MRIEASKYKSINAFSVSLPKFVILTGVNGSGKTHFLEGMHRVFHVHNGSGGGYGKKEYIGFAQLVPKLGNRDSPNGTRYPHLRIMERKYSEYQERSHRPSLRSVEEKEIYESIASQANKNVTDLTFDDFSNYYPLHIWPNSEDLLSFELSEIFQSYYNLQEENDYRRFQAMRGKDRTFLEDEEFLHKYGEPPWDTINKIFESFKFRFRVAQPLLDGDDKFDVKIISEIDGLQFPITQLSSGEKVIISLLLAIGKSKHNIDFPNLLLLDEPDATLHPSMIKQFLYIVQDVFVKEKDVSVVMTTHSPTTLAIAPENSVYMMDRTKPIPVYKVTRDTALNMLTSGVPSFSVNYENRRQVFVESPNDAFYYETIYNLLFSYLDPEISLSFISSGEIRFDVSGNKIANRGQVENAVSVLRTAKNRFIWGIVDWDLEDPKTPFVEALGKGKRYSVENYLFDPIFLSAALLREQYPSLKREGWSIADFKSYDNTTIQLIVDRFFEMLPLSVYTDLDTEPVLVRLVNGEDISMPQWYLHYQGHELEKIILDVFPILKGVISKRQESLQNYMLKYVVSDFPFFLSNDFIETFTNIQEANRTTK